VSDYFDRRDRNTKKDAAAVDALMDEYESWTEVYPWERGWRTWPNGVATMLERTWPGAVKRAVTLRVIVSSDTGKGTASGVLRRITGLADTHQVKLVLSARSFTGIEGRLSDEQLIAWYGRHGWEKRRGHPPREMIRVPDLLGDLFGPKGRGNRPTRFWTLAPGKGVRQQKTRPRVGDPLVLWLKETERKTAKGVQVSLEPSWGDAPTRHRGNRRTEAKRVFATFLDGNAEALPPVDGVIAVKSGVQKFPAGIPGFRATLRQFCVDPGPGYRKVRGRWFRVEDRGTAGPVDVPANFPPIWILPIPGRGIAVFDSTMVGHEATWPKAKRPAPWDQVVRVETCDEALAALRSMVEPFARQLYGSLDPPGGRGSRAFTVHGVVIDLEPEIEHLFACDLEHDMIEEVTEVVAELNRLRFPLKVWRGLDGIYDVSKIRWTDIGASWATTRSSAEAFGDVLLSGTLRRAADVDWQSTVERRVRFDVLAVENWSLADDDRPECELVVRRGRIKDAALAEPGGFGGFG
jgi:hypothetical protein